MKRNRMNPNCVFFFFLAAAIQQVKQKNNGNKGKMRSNASLFFEFFVVVIIPFTQTSNFILGTSCVKFFPRTRIYEYTKLSSQNKTQSCNNNTRKILKMLESQCLFRRWQRKTPRLITKVRYTLPRWMQNTQPFIGHASSCIVSAS